MRLRGRTAVLFFFTAFLFSFSTPAFAELLPSLGSSLEIGISPEHPHPRDTVTLTVSDYASDPGSTAYIWSVNDKVVEQGIGKTSITLVAGVLGSFQTVSVLASENGVARGNTSIIIRPASVDLVWEGDTYTPPLYIGRPLPNGQSTIHVLAVPHLPNGSSESPPDSVVYSWSVNGLPLPKQSGYGKSSAIITPPKFDTPFTIRVTASTKNGATVAENSQVIEPRAPTILLYENAPLLGVRFDTTLKDAFPFAGDEVSFIAYPLFVSSADALSYTWRLDTKPFTIDATKPRFATFRKVGEGGGAHTITISFENVNKFLEHGTKTFQLTF